MSLVASTPKDIETALALAENVNATPSLTMKRKSILNRCNSADQINCISANSGLKLPDKYFMSDYMINDNGADTNNNHDNFSFNHNNSQHDESSKLSELFDDFRKHVDHLKTLLKVKDTIIEQLTLENIVLRKDYKQMSKKYELLNEEYTVTYAYFMNKEQQQQQHQQQLPNNENNNKECESNEIIRVEITESQVEEIRHADYESDKEQPLELYELSNVQDESDRGHKEKKKGVLNVKNKMKAKSHSSYTLYTKMRNPFDKKSGGGGVKKATTFPKIADHDSSSQSRSPSTSSAVVTTAKKGAVAKKVRLQLEKQAEPEGLEQLYETKWNSKEIKPNLWSAIKQRFLASGKSIENAKKEPKRLVNTKRQFKVDFDNTHIMDES